MRIIRGKYRGKQIHTPGNLPVRPTTDFAKEALFNILNNLIDLEDITVLDLFSGTGNISYEFFSRGAREITAIETDRRCAAFIERTGQLLTADCLTVFQSDVFQFLKHAFSTWDIIFADPPFSMENIGELPDLVFQKNLLNKDGYFILEHSKRQNFAEHPFFDQQRIYGNVNFSFFRQK